MKNFFLIFNANKTQIRIIIIYYSNLGYDLAIKHNYNIKNII